MVEGQVISTDKLNSRIEKMAHHPARLKENMVRRLNRIEGQIRGIAKMIAEDVYCDEVIHQILSVEAAIDGVKKTLLEAHIKGCVINQIRSGDNDAVDELMITVGKLIK